MPDGEQLYQQAKKRPEADISYMIGELSRVSEGSLTEWEQGFIPDMVDLLATSQGATNRFSILQLENIKRLYRKYYE